MTEQSPLPTPDERPALAVDLVLLSVVDRALHVLLVPAPTAGNGKRWSLPGAVVAIDESLDAAARRVLRGLTSAAGVYLEQLYTFGKVGRHPAGRVIGVAYYALLARTAFETAIEATDEVMPARLAVRWEGETGGPAQALDRGGVRLRLALDHADILGLTVKRLRGKLDYTPVGFGLLPDSFTLRELQLVHEAILGKSLNKPAFRRRVLDKGFLRKTGRRETGVTYRPAELYRFTARPVD